MRTPGEYRLEPSFGAGSRLQELDLAVFSWLGLAVYSRWGGPMRYSRDLERRA